jgi:hypothetical protein
VLEQKRESAVIHTELFSEVLSTIREEFDEHLESINDNTAEVQQSFSCLAELDEKINKLATRLEKVELYLENKGFETSETPKFHVRDLTEREKSLFLVIYKLENERMPITYRSIQKHSCLPKTLIQGYIASMIEKGIPITKSHKNNIVQLKLDPQFKAIQAKQNIVKLEQQTLQHILA